MLQKMAQKCVLKKVLHLFADTTWFDILLST